MNLTENPQFCKYCQYHLFHWSHILSTAMSYSGDIVQILKDKTFIIFSIYFSESESDQERQSFPLQRDISRKVSKVKI